MPRLRELYQYNDYKACRQPPSYTISTPGNGTMPRTSLIPITCWIDNTTPHNGTLYPTQLEINNKIIREVNAEELTREAEIAQVRQEIKALEKLLLAKLEEETKERKSEDHDIRTTIKQVMLDLQKSINALEASLLAKLEKEIKAEHAFAEKKFNELEAKRKAGDGDLTARVDKLEPQRGGLSLSAQDTTFIETQFTAMEERLAKRFEARISALEAENASLRSAASDSKSAPPAPKSTSLWAGVALVSTTGAATGYGYATHAARAGGKPGMPPRFTPTFFNSASLRTVQMGKAVRAALRMFPK